MSRIVDEMAKEMVTVPMCLREDDNCKELLLRLLWQVVTGRLSDSRVVLF